MASTVVVLLLGSVDSFLPKLFGRGLRTPLELLLLPLATTVLHEELQDISEPINSAATCWNISCSCVIHVIALLRKLYLN
jgi:hypothetical protein